MEEELDEEDKKRIEEYKRKYEEYENKVKKKTDRELMESIALKVKRIELDNDELGDFLLDGLDDVQNSLDNISNFLNGMKEDFTNSNDEDGYDFERDEDKRKTKREMEDMREQINEDTLKAIRKERRRAEEEQRKKDLGPFRVNRQI